MKIILHQTTYDLAPSIEDFLDRYYSVNMRYWASDLLDKGLSPKQINDAVVVAIKIASASGLEIRKHFKPMLSGTRHELIQDCRLSRLAFGLVLLNADSNLAAVGAFQLGLLEHVLRNNSELI